MLHANLFLSTFILSPSVFKSVLLTFEDRRKKVSKVAEFIFDFGKGAWIQLAITNNNKLN